MKAVPLYLNAYRHRRLNKHQGGALETETSVSKMKGVKDETAAQRGCAPP